MFLVVLRDLSTERYQKGKKPLNHSILSDKSPRKDKFDENSWNGPARKFLTFCQIISWPFDRIFSETDAKKLYI